MILIGSGAVDGLDFARGPANHGLLDLRELAQTKMQSPLILRGESTPSRNFLYLLLTVPKQRDLRADCASITLGPLEIKLDPLVFGNHRVFVNEQRPSLIGDNDVEHALIP